MALSQFYSGYEGAAQGRAFDLRGHIGGCPEAIKRPIDAWAIRATAALLRKLVRLVNALFTTFGEMCVCRDAVVILSCVSPFTGQADRNVGRQAPGQQRP